MNFGLSMTASRRSKQARDQLVRHELDILLPRLAVPAGHISALLVTLARRSHLAWQRRSMRWQRSSKRAVRYKKYVKGSNVLKPAGAQYRNKRTMSGA